MIPDPDLDALTRTWRTPMPDTLEFAPPKLSHVARWEARVGYATALFLGTFALGAGGDALRRGDLPQGALAVFAAVLAVATGRAVARLRARAAEADALLTGTPLQLLEGRRRHLQTRLCSIRGRTAWAFTLVPVGLWGALAAAGAVPLPLAAVSAVGYAAWLAGLHLRTAPRLAAELRRVEAWIGELGGA